MLDMFNTTSFILNITLGISANPHALNVRLTHFYASKRYLSIPSILEYTQPSHVPSMRLF